MTISDLNFRQQIVDEDGNATAYFEDYLFNLFTEVNRLVDGINISSPLTAFGDLRTAGLHPQFQGSFEYTVDNTELTTNAVVAGGTVTQASGMAVVGTSTTTASSALLQSKIAARYRAGLGGLVRFTTLFTTAVAATEQYIGIVDETGSSAAFKNGYMVGYDGETFGFHRFQNDSKNHLRLRLWQPVMKRYRYVRHTQRHAMQ